MTPANIFDYSRLFCSLLTALLSLLAPLGAEISSARSVIRAGCALFALAWSNVVFLWTLSILHHNAYSLSTLHSVFFAIAATLQVDRLSDDPKRLWTPYKWAWCLGCISDAIGVAHFISRRNIDYIAWLDLAFAIGKLLVYAGIQCCVSFGSDHRYKRVPQDDAESTIPELDEIDIETGPGTAAKTSQLRDQFKIFWRFIWPSNNRAMKGRFILALVLNSGIQVVGLWIPHALGRFIDRLPIAKTWGSVVFPVIFWFALEFSSPILLGLKQRVWIKLRSYRSRSLDKATYANIMNADHSFHTTKSPTELINSVDKAKGVENSFDGLVEHSADGLFMIYVMIPVIAARFNQSILSLIAVCLMTKYVIFRRAVTALFRANDVLISLNELHKKRREDTVRGRATAAAFQQLGYLVGANDSRIEELGQALDTYLIHAYWFWASNLLVDCVGQYVGILLVCDQVLSGNMTTGDIFVWLAYWNQVASPVTAILKALENLSKSFQDAAKAGEILDMKPRATQGKGLTVTQGGLELKDITLSLGGNAIFENFNLSVPGGTKVALVGPSGVGKSTIIGLLSGQIVPDSGEVLVDGQNINEADHDVLASHIGVLEQKPHVYDTTVKDNVLYGKREATDEEVEAACRKACIHDDIVRREKGYETPCGVDGKHFSGGQVQRITIARLFLMDPKILLIDEGTSALDAATEGFIKRSIAETFESRTVVTVAHRLSSIRQADIIIVLGEKGEIVESGTHDTLLKLKRKYWEYWQEHLGEQS
ncbi:ABC transporter aclQ [Colletotrichum aenigma]|uniref:ABC transporter aclQ n=1 Tax=Colletotrichum aenigma TaxID=1215731 RepID=UPI00187239A7|nr:ABC transporter aclQ [Colletotrichum aenigma]KAF5512203.1 ABC transporter aclQ [Colletotrichum aenigma]